MLNTLQGIQMHSEGREPWDQWPHASSERDPGVIPCWGTKIPRATQHSQKRKERKKVWGLLWQSSD